MTPSDFDWSIDPAAAASGARWRARRGVYELGAYEDGRWYVSKDGEHFAAGSIPKDLAARGHALNDAKWMTVMLLALTMVPRTA